MNIFLGKPSVGVEAWIKEHYVPTPTPRATPLCFTAQETNSNITFSTTVGSEPVSMFYPEMNLQYSYDGITWTPMDFSTAPTPITLSNIGDKVYIKAITENPIENWSYYESCPPCKFSINGKVAASGSIQYLLKSDGSRMDVPENGFRSMFEECRTLTTIPDLPATTLGKNCYTNMFNFCLALTNEPNLPATTLGDNCYEGMFEAVYSVHKYHMKSSMSNVYNLIYHGLVGPGEIVYDL